MLPYLTIGIFGIAFILIAFEVYDKSLIALTGALLMVTFGILSPREAIAAIQFETILLLLAMMILVNIASKSGVFVWLNTKIASLTRGNPLALFVLFSLLTATFSAFLDNVTTVVLIVPLTIELLKGMGKDPKPFIFAEIIFSNIGGGLTLIGDPSNIIIGGATGFSFATFVRNLWIPIAASSVLALIAFIIVNWRKLRPISDDLVELHITNILLEKIRRTFLKIEMDRFFVIKVITILFATLLGFTLQGYIGLPTYVIAFLSAIFLGLLTSRQIDIHESFKSVEWTTLFFFAGLFIMVGGVEKTGLLELLSSWLTSQTTDLFYLSLVVLWSCAAISMFLDNIPFVTVMVPVILALQHDLPGIDTSILWWALSLGAVLGGNATLIGASANVIATDLARQRGITISFFNYMKFALPLVIGFLFISSAYLFYRTSL